MDQRDFIKGSIFAGATTALGVGFSQTGAPLLEDYGEEQVAKTDIGKILFVYYSLTGHTRGMANRIRTAKSGNKRMAYGN